MRTGQGDARAVDATCWSSRWRRLDYRRGVTGGSGDIFGGGGQRGMMTSFSVGSSDTAFILKSDVQMYVYIIQNITIIIKKMYVYFIQKNVTVRFLF